MISENSIDSCERVVWDGDMYLLTRKGDSVSIEMGEEAYKKPLTFIVNTPKKRGILRAANKAV